MLPPDTYTVSQLGEELQLILSETLSGVWVAGEVRRPTQSRAGHLYFELVEKGRGDSVRGSIQAVLFRMDNQRVQRNLRRSGIELAEGQTIRCYGGVDFYPAGGRLQLIARDVDPVFSLGDLAQRRQETLRQLSEKGLLELNSSLALPELPLRIALLTSIGSAAERDFMTTLGASGFAFEVIPMDVAVQGASAERDVVRALAQAQHALSTDPDALESSLIVLVRGGGSKTDLVAFDSLGVAEAVAQCGFPVLTGLGHEIDESVADLVAHRAFKTPTAVAEFLCRTIERQSQDLEVLGLALESAARSSLNAAQRTFAAAELRLQAAGGRLDRHQRKVDRLARRLQWLSSAMTRDGNRTLAGLEQRLERVAAPRVAGGKTTIAALGRALQTAADRQLQAADQHLREQQRLVGYLSPERTLERGFSITRAADGTVVRSVTDVDTGQVLQTQLSNGTVDSTVV